MNQMWRIPWVVGGFGPLACVEEQPRAGFEKRQSLKTETAMFHIPKRRLSQKITLRDFSKDETRQDK
jgi:hypothetical protein